MEDKLKWNFTIRLILQGYIEITFSAAITFMFVQTNTFGGKFNFALAIFFLIVVIVLPIFVIVFYIKNFERMSSKEDTEFDAKFGSVYDGLKPYQKMSLFHPFWMCFRRIYLVILVFYLYWNTTIQLSLLQVSNFIAFCYVAEFRPYDDYF